jgi:hypothetical protein
LIEEAKRLIREKPQSRADLTKALTELDAGAGVNYLRNTLFEKLQDEPGIFLHLGANGYVLSTEKPDFEKYIKTLAARFRQVSTVLEKAGFERGAIQEGVTGEKAAAPSAGTPSRLRPPAADSEIDFQRDVAELLVYAWQDSTREETRQSLEAVMTTLGLEHVETAGQTVEFNGLSHRSQSPASAGDRVCITLPGWRLKNSRGNYLIAKAEVEPIS